MPNLPRPEAVMAWLTPHGVPIARTLLRQQLVGLFGPPPVDLSVGRGDPGLCGPGSASWQVIGDPAAIVGGIRGLLVQVMHPSAMAGVTDHSRYLEDPVGRLQATASWVGTITFGACQQVLAAADRVRAAHDHVRGTTPAGRSYAAGDPELLSWVQCALTVSFLAADAQYAARPIDQTARDRFVLEQSRAAALLDPRVDLADVPTTSAAMAPAIDDLPLMSEGHLPRTEAELLELLAGFGDQLRVGRQGRTAVSFLRSPPLPQPVSTAYRVLLGGAVATLPRNAQARLGLHTIGPRGISVARARVLLTAMRTANGSSPARRLAQRRAVATG